MAARRYGKQQIARILEEVASGAPVAEVCRKYHVSRTTIHRWQKKSRATAGQEQPGQPKASTMEQPAASEFKLALARLERLEEENVRLKRIVVRQALDIDAFEERAASRKDSFPI